MLRRSSGLVVAAIAVACTPARPAKMVAVADDSKNHIDAGEAFNNHGPQDDLDFKVPPQSLERCAAAGQRPDVDPAPQLSEQFSVRTLRAGCENELNMNARATNALTSMRMRITVDADGKAQKAEVLPDALQADKALQDCLMASAMRNPFPKNKNNKSYEQIADIVYFYSYVGETRWKMLDTVRRMDEPTRETCGCMIDNPITEPVSFSVSFTLPETAEPAKPVGVQVSGDHPIAQCYGKTMENRVFYGRGSPTEVNFQYKVLPRANQ